MYYWKPIYNSEGNVHANKSSWAATVYKQLGLTVCTLPSWVGCNHIILSKKSKWLRKHTAKTNHCGLECNERMYSIVKTQLIASMC